MRKVGIKKTTDGRTGLHTTAITTANTHLYLAPFFKKSVYRLVYNKYFVYSNILKDSLEKSSRITDIIFL